MSSAHARRQLMKAQSEWMRATFHVDGMTTPKANNNNNNNHDNVYGAVIMAEPLQEFTRFI